MRNEEEEGARDHMDSSREVARRLGGSALGQSREESLENEGW